jgi:nucleotide-binding universal stress UspA family protein
MASDLGINVTRIIEVGSVSTLLPKRVVAEKADLVFYPLTPYKRYGADLQRRTVRQLLRTIKPDLAIMRVITMARPHPGHILVPLEKVISSKERRLLFVTELAKSFHAKVTLYHLFAARDIKTMPDAITQFGKQLRLQDIKVSERSGSGLLGKAVTVEAITRHNDLIILGASKRGLFRRIFSGNPAGDVMRQPPCNTILFRAEL